MILDWEKGKIKCINRIVRNIEDDKDICQSLSSLIDNLYYVNIEEIRPIIDRLQKMLLVKFSEEVVILWRKIVVYYRSETMMDDFFDFYWVTKDKRNISSEIVALYSIYGMYYLKFMKEIKEDPQFNDICEDLQDKYLQRLEQLKNEFGTPETAN